MLRPLRIEYEGDRYGYDEAGQLTASYQAQNPQGDATNAQRGDSFTYDALGNRMGSSWVASRGAMNFTMKENGLNQYSGWWPYSVIRYDDDIGLPWGTPQHANGVIMQEGWITGGFNALNQPMMITGKPYLGTPKWMWFGFDPLGRCVKRWVGSADDPNPAATYYYYDGWNLLQEGASAGSAQRLYIHGARVDEIVKSINYTTGQSAWHHYDARGHCTHLTGPSGDIIEQYDYDAFGFPYFYDGQGNSLTFYDGPSQSMRGYSPHGNRFLFTGREWLTDLRLYDYRNRLYHPELGRFLQPDPKHFAANDYNLYRYCHNDPINRTDPMGLADSVTIEFAPQVGNIFLQIVPDKYVDSVGGSESRAASIMLPQGGLTTTATQDPKTGDIHVQQKIKITTWVKKSEDEAGNTAKLAKEELSRVNLFREGAGTAQDKANNLARQGFKDVESAKKAVEESTKKTMLDTAREGKLKWDLPGGGKLRKDL